jgi:hypothetical protein
MVGGMGSPTACSRVVASRLTRRHDGVSIRRGKAASSSRAPGKTCSPLHRRSRLSRSTWPPFAHQDSALPAGPFPPSAVRDQCVPRKRRRARECWPMPSKCVIRTGVESTSTPSRSKRIARQWSMRIVSARHCAGAGWQRDKARRILQTAGPAIAISLLLNGLAVLRL